MNFKKIISGLLLVTFLVGCTASNKILGTGGGAAIGGTIGYIIGGDTTSTGIGAGVGALAGLGWGAYRDAQEAELKDKLSGSGAVVSRDGENLMIYLPGGVTFRTDSHSISSGFYEPLNAIADVLNSYPETRMLISGHTDTVGRRDYNVNLSLKRANSVKSFLTGRGVASSRLITEGYGPDRPVASNNTSSGKAQNRRVEIRILPNQN